MDNKFKEGWGCCLVEILFLAAAFLTIYFAKDINKEYLVEETNYIHSTGSNDKCSFIKKAHEKDYTISRIKKDDAIRQNKKICKECYPIEEQADFNKSVAERKENELYLSDAIKWSPIRLKFNSVDYNELYVYMEHNGVLHINGKCGWLIGEKKELERVPFANITSFKSTCEDCVDTELVEFIYKAVYENVYDKDLIRDEEDY